MTKFQNWISSGHPDGANTDTDCAQEIRFKVDSRWAQELNNDFKDWTRANWTRIIESINSRVRVRFPELQRQLEVVESTQKKGED